MSKAQEIRERVDALVEEGKSRPEAFKQVAGERGIKLDSVRGVNYTAARGSSGTRSRPRRRETTL